jgi:hypothetical protein
MNCGRSIKPHKLSSQYIIYIRSHLQSLPPVDLFGNSGDTRGIQNGGMTGLVSLCELNVGIKR